MGCAKCTDSGNKEVSIAVTIIFYPLPKLVLKDKGSIYRGKVVISSIRLIQNIV